MGIGTKSVVAVFLSSVFVWRQYNFLGYNNDPSTRANKHFDGFSCSHILHDSGAEDIEVTSDGTAFITSGLMYPPFTPIDSGRIGTVYSVDLNVSPVSLNELTIVAEKDLKLNPHGLSVFETGDKVLLYVVNHKTDVSGDSIEKFEYDKQKSALVWVASIASPGVLRSVNDIVLVAEDEFFATNDFYTTHDYPILRAVEMFSMIRLGSVAFCKGVQCSIKSSYNLQMPNGITARDVINPETSESEHELLVVQAFDTAIVVFDIGANGDLTFKRTIKAPATTDNPWVAPDGSIYFAGVNLSWRLFVTEPEQFKGGSEISRLAPNAYALTQEYKDDGEQFSGASIAVLWGDNILVGSPFGNLMECHKSK